MTDNQIQDLKADIAFMRALAQEGQQAPLLGGSILVAAGAYFGAASLVAWAIAAGVLRVSPWANPIVWGVAMALFFTTLVIVRRGQRGKAGARNPANRATGVAWSAVGWTICILAFAIALISWRVQSAVPTLIFPSLILGLYGGGWSVAAAMSGKRWIWITAIGSYAGALLTAFFSTSPLVFLIYAIALFLLAVVPGLALMRQEPSDVI